MVFSVVAVVGALTDSANPRDYRFKIETREKDETGVEFSTICRQQKLESADGMRYETDCADTEGIFRIVQSIPSPKSEPFKRWLAKVGFERVKEIENPELATKRTRLLYKRKGYSDDWIEKRVRVIALANSAKQVYLPDEDARRGNQGTGNSKDWRKGGRAMTLVEMKEAKESVARYATQSRESPVVFTSKGKPVAALMDLHNVDWETLSLSLNPEFIAIIEKSRKRHRRDGGVSSQEMRRRLGVEQR